MQEFDKYRTFDTFACFISYIGCFTVTQSVSCSTEIICYLFPCKSTNSNRLCQLRSQIWLFLPFAEKVCYWLYLPSIDFRRHRVSFLFGCGGNKLFIPHSSICYSLRCPYNVGRPAGRCLRTPPVGSLHFPSPATAACQAWVAGLAGPQAHHFIDVPIGFLCRMLAAV